MKKKGKESKKENEGVVTLNHVVHEADVCFILLIDIFPILNKEKNKHSFLSEERHADERQRNVCMFTHLCKAFAC